MSSTSIPRLLVLASLLAAVPGMAAVGIAQADNAADRSFERLPSLRLVRGGAPKSIVLDVTAETAEGWTLSSSVPWAVVSPTSGAGPRTATITFDGAALARLDDPRGTITITGTSGGATNTRSLDVDFDIFPKVFSGDLVDGSDDAALRAWARQPANWPKDGFSGGWELWGFLPDDVSHPDRLEGVVDVDLPERTACVGDETAGCTRPGQAGLTAGMKADQGWLLSTGDPRVVVGVLDSGIRWSERNLNEKHYLNARELVSCPPPGADLDNADRFVGFDVNGDGMFTIRDYDDAPWLDDVNLNGLRDPQDLIWADNGAGPCSDSVDDDDNGYVDDISGWDFFWNDNDPSDDADFGHGTGEANDSVSEIHDDSGRGGICPRCLLLNVRVGDSFVVDVNQFAEGAVFVVDSGADVIQEALGSINNTPFAQAAIDYAYFNNVPIVASAADETSYHHNFPGAGEHTLYVHAIVHDDRSEFESSTFLNFNNCTNFGGHLTLSTPGEGCSSEATGNTAGQMGLVKSYFLQEQDRAVGTPRAPYFEAPLTTEEAYQLLIVSAEDIDVDGAEADPEALALRKFPSNEGWDLHFGYGRNDVRGSLELIRDQQIPPEVNISAPRWFQVFDPAVTPGIEVRASVSSPRLNQLRWELHVAETIAGALTKVAEGSGPVGDNQGVDAVIATVDIRTQLPQMFARAADVATGEAEQFSGTLELRVFGTNPAGDEVAGVFRKTFGVRRDEQVLPGFPLFLGASGESSPKLTDIDGDGFEEIVLATSDGLVHAIGRNAVEIAGFPVSLSTYGPLDPAGCAASPEKCHRNSRAYGDVVGGIDPDGVKTSVLATVAVADLDGDDPRCRDVVVASLDGFVFAFDCRGAPREGFPLTIDRTTLTDGLTGARRCENDAGEPIIGCRDEQQHGESGFFSTPVVVDLDDDDDLEVVVAGLDSRLYAWHDDGAVVGGFPVHLDHPSIPAFNADGSRHRLVDRIVASPTIADLDGDGTPWIVVGTGERVVDDTRSFIYAVHPEGTRHDGGAFAPGWPVAMQGLFAGEILPFIGRGNPNSPASGDLDNDGNDEVVNAGLGGFMVVIDGNGRIIDPAMGSLSSSFGADSDLDDSGAIPVLNNPTLADLDGDGFLDVINGVAGLGLRAVAEEGGKRSVFNHAVGAWFAADGAFMDGFPKQAADYQFFMNYVVADIDGDGKGNVISGDGGYFVWATNPDGSQAPGFPKWTQGWHITTPAVGDLDGNGLIDVVASTREGWLYAWGTRSHVGGPPDTSLAAIQWESFHRDDQNTGNASGKFAALKPYDRLREPQDAVDGCGCAASSTNPTASTMLAAWLGLGTLGIVRRRRRLTARSTPCS